MMLTPTMSMKQERSATARSAARRVAAQEVRP